MIFNSVFTMLRMCVLLGLLALAQCQDEDGKVVETQQGPVKGYLSKEGNFYQFLGIPYATAPRGMDKFKAPLDPPTWTDVFEATNNMTVCPQPHVGYLTLELAHETPDEDCLLINVFVPNTDKKDLPVMVYIHGGAFFMGIGKMVSHEPLLRHDVIVINFNYRLGVYGFLCLGTRDVPGNAGLKDQVAALRWVKRNIASFGGNPDDITLGGFSSGSASAEHLMLSPMTKGLFTKVIAESGSALSPWAMTPDPIAMAKRYMVELTGASTDNIREIADYFKTISTMELTEKDYLSEKESMFGFVPCVEAKIKGVESFYNESPLDILKKGNYHKVPFMPGFGTEEGLFRFPQFISQKFNWGKLMEENFADFLPQDLAFKDEAEKQSVAAKVKKFYFKNAPVNQKTLKKYVDYFTDVMFGCAIVKSAKLHALNSVPVYLYDFGYIHDPVKASKAKLKGASHCSQSGTVHNFISVKKEKSKNDTLMQDRLTKMWSDFAKLGTPVSETTELLPVAWEPVDPERMNYLHMDLEFEIRENILDKRCKFWDKIYDQYYRPPLPLKYTPGYREEL